MKDNNLLNRMFPKPLYVIWTFKEENSPEINIEGEDLIYNQLGKSHHGLQCNLTGGHPNHKIISKICNGDLIVRQRTYLGHF